jgi:hypothetical protein
MPGQVLRLLAALADYGFYSEVGPSVGCSLAEMMSLAWGPYC